MVSAPQNSVQYGRLGTVFSVRIGDKDGNAPTDQDEFLEVIPLTIELGTGGDDLDRAAFQVSLGLTGQRIVDFQVDPKMNRQVEVYAIDEDGEYVPLFWGEYDQQNLEIIRSGEYVVITASVQKHHFGTPLQGPEEYDKVTDENVIIEADLIFNPQIDDRIYDNRREDPNQTDQYLFVDPRSRWTSTAKTYLNATAEAWTVETAAKTLARLANESESLIKNPSTYTVVNLAAAIKNFTLRRGLYLNEAFDELLTPHGFSWYLQLELDSDGALEKKIHLISQGTGIEKQVYFQRPGEVLDLTKSNVPEVSLDTNISELANRVTVYGGFIKKEVTVEIFKCWHPDQDSLTPDEVQRKDEAGSQFELYPNVHRKWALGEGGDYIGLRPEFGNAPTDLTFFDPQEGEEYVHKRRRTEPLLTYDKELNRRPQYLEYFDNSLSAWQPVPPEWGYRVLDDEIGIYFTGNKPPAELWEQGADNVDNMRLRLTCVVACDKRISHTAERRPSSPNGRDIELTLDASDRFFKKTVHTSSSFYGDEQLLNDEVDSTTDIEEYAESLRDINDSANLQVYLNLFGIYHSYQRGDLITKIDGRNISLNRNSSDVATKKFLQVTRVVWDYQNQRTGLITAAFTRGDTSGNV